MWLNRVGVAGEGDGDGGCCGGGAVAIMVMAMVMMMMKPNCVPFFYPHTLNQPFAHYTSLGKKVVKGILIIKRSVKGRRAEQYKTIHVVRSKT